MITEPSLVTALVALGFTDGWAVSGDTITLWENEALQPTEEELVNAGWVKPDETPTADA